MKKGPVSQTERCTTRNSCIGIKLLQAHQLLHYFIIKCKHLKIYTLQHFQTSQKFDNNVYSVQCCNSYKICCALSQATKTLKKTEHAQEAYKFDCSSHYIFTIFNSALYTAFNIFTFLYQTCEINSN